MKFRYYYISLFVIILLLGLAACTRSKNSEAASVPEPTMTLAGEGQPPSDDVMSQLELFVTQTAMAAMGEGNVPTAPAPTTNVPGEGTPVNAEQTPEEEQPPLASPTPQPTATPIPTEKPTATIIVVPTATPGIPSNYTLKSGEFVYCIARRFNVDPNEILRVNGMTGNSYVYAGMTLKIPQSGKTFPGNRALMKHPTTYTVRSGDTIFSIACDFGDADPNAIIYANGLKAPYALTPGQTIYIP
jgi:LysM repeat protein